MQDLLNSSAKYDTLPFTNSMEGSQFLLLGHRSCFSITPAPVSREEHQRLPSTKAGLPPTYGRNGSPASS
jgi:hypothetical protein